MKAKTFWGVAFIAIGILLLLSQIGVLPGNAWSYVWPLALVAFGAMVLFGAINRRPLDSVSAAIPLEDIDAAHVAIKHSAGRLEIEADPAQPANSLVEGVFVGGVERNISKVGHRADVTLKSPMRWTTPWEWSGLRDGLAWNVKFAPQVQLDLDVDTGASDSYLNLTDLQVRQLNIHTGASSMHMTMPAQAGFTRAHLESGATSVQVKIPEGVAAHITGRMGLGSLQVDELRFPRRNGSYESLDYATAPNRVEMEIEGGVGAINVD